MARAYIMHGAPCFLTESAPVRTDGRILYRSRWRAIRVHPTSGAWTIRVDGVNTPVTVSE